MKKIIYGALIALAFVFVIRSCSDDKREKSILKENSMLIQQQIENVSKLIVTEGHFAEVYSYKDSQQVFGSLFTADKNALVVVNAEVMVAYDLSNIKFEIDAPNKTLKILSIPEPEIKLNPDFEYYDITADYFNPFKADDYNKINQNVRASLLKKIEFSSLKTNAENRLISELSKFYILTNSLGWRLVYGEIPITSPEELRLTNEIPIN
ncbi:DUF4230 domain-containing protein [Arenibacter sp. GZD96]|uniref:DUF4230 domain-containing protein n=1 Tax=Aurantibrevibacter litoralis TaxID=3106030 RepID=UPI002AFE5ECF|nr:DUF4230 domain-containing protein [Arenibacter sp. GZD-96]MEA1785795.1 DUF4230 domain-containing protein [Arenibacter sp. GZD-96]